MSNSIIWEALRYLTWPGAVAAVAFSPLGKGIAEWLKRAGHSPDNMPMAVADAFQQVSKTLAEVTAAQRLLSDGLNELTSILRQMQTHQLQQGERLALLLDRVPRSGKDD